MAVHNNKEIQLLSPDRPCTAWSHFQLGQLRSLLALHLSLFLSMRSLFLLPSRVQHKFPMRYRL